MAEQEEVYLLLVETGRTAEDGLPEGAVGAGVLCHAPGRDEADAVNETVSLLRSAGLAPLDVTSYGTAEERRAAGEAVAAEDQAFIDQARAQNAVIVVAITPFFDGDETADMPVV
ncbi:MAG: hypothetical protein AAGC92_09085 [Pseudomonadota bacterium]